MFKYLQKEVLNTLSSKLQKFWYLGVLSQQYFVLVGFFLVFFFQEQEVTLFTLIGGHELFDNNYRHLCFMKDTMYSVYLFSFKLANYP